MLQQEVADGVDRLGVACLDERESGNNRYPLGPKMGALGIFLEVFPISTTQKKLSYNLRSAQIHQVPIIDVGSVFQVEMIKGFGLRIVGFFHALHQEHQRQQTAFVVGVAHQAFQNCPVVLRQLATVLLGQSPRLRNGDPIEQIALTIFALSCLEKRLQDPLFFLPVLSGKTGEIFTYPLCQSRKQSRRTALIPLCFHTQW